MSYHKKLIEVALPLNAINEASANEKSTPPGHPSTLHLWWARRPLAACRAVLFASLVDDPSEHSEQFPTEEDQERERKRLFQLFEEFVPWKNVKDKKVFKKVYAEILKATNGNLPPILAKSTLLPPLTGRTCDTFHAQKSGLATHLTSLT